MKKVILCLSMFVLALTANAQDKTLLRHAHHETNRFVDNWEVSLGAGIQAFHINQSEPFNGLSDEIVPMFEVSVGKWLTPIFGARLAFQGFNYKFMNSEIEYKGNYNYVHADVMMNMSNLICGYKSDRLYNAILMGGFGYAASKSEEMDGYNNEFAASFGLMNRFRLCESFSLNLDVRTFLTKESFGNIRNAGMIALNYELLAGITYKISSKKNFDRVDYTPYQNKISALEKDLNSSREDLAKKDTEVEKLKKQVEKEIAAKEKAMDEAVRAKKLATPTANQPLSIFFRLGDSEITDRNVPNLKFLADAMKADKSDRVFVIVGYADKQTGSPEVNMELSKKRAEGIYNLLIKEGVDAKKLKAEWKGDTEQPFEGRPYMNRVVVIK